MKKENSKREAIELINKAYNLVEGGKLEEAKRLLKRAIDICDEIADGHNELGAVYCHLGDFSSAYHHALRAIELDPTNPKYHNSLAFTLMSMSRLDDALVSARTAIGLDPNYASAQNLVSKILKMKGEPEEASYYEGKAQKIYASTGMRSNGHKLKEGDLERIFSGRETIKIPESIESINVKGIKWALSQIKKNPDAAKSKTVREAIMNPIARWSFVIIMPIAGFLGFIKPGQIVLDHRLMFIVFGLCFVLLAVIAERAYKNPRINVRSALLGEPVNPIRVGISIEFGKNIGYGMITYCLGTLIHKAFSTYELAMALLGVILLIKAIWNLGTKHGWYPVSVMKDAHYINGKNYVNRQYDFSISSPEGWGFETKTKIKGILVSFGAPERDASINVAVNALYGSNILKGGIINVANYYVKKIYSDLHSNEKGSMITLNVSEMCENFPAIQVDYPLFGLHMRKIALFLKTRLYGGYEFLITCSAPKNKFHLYEDTFNQCVQTFRFLHLDLYLCKT